MWGCDAAIDVPDELRPPGWVELGREFTLNNDADCWKDPEVSKSIMSLDESFVPLLCRWIFLKPADVQTSVRERVIFKRHALGRTDMQLSVANHTTEEAKDCYDSLTLNNIEIPPYYIGRKPKFLDPTVGVMSEPSFFGLAAISFDPREKYQASDLPGPYVPWDWNLFYALKRMYTRSHTVESLKQKLVRDRIQGRKDRAAALRHDFAVNYLDFQMWANRQIQAKAGDGDIQREMARHAEIQRKARLARMGQSVSFRSHGIS